MTWGSNPTFAVVRCRYCGQECVDDMDHGPSHEMECPNRPWWKRMVTAAIVRLQTRKR
jgi:hypothetical protein